LASLYDSKQNVLEELPERELNVSMHSNITVSGVVLLPHDF